MEDLKAFTIWIEEYADRHVLGEPVPERPSCEVSRLFRSARRGGRAVLPATAALRAELRAAGGLAGRRAAMARLAGFRLILAGGFAVAGRAWLTSGDLLPGTATDAICLALAVTIAAAFQIGMRRHLPVGWLWREGLSADGLLWLGALLGERTAPAALQPLLDGLRSDELRRGLSRRDAREAALADYARKRTEADAERLTRAEAAWPLAELAGIGLPVLLVLSGCLRF